MSSDLSFFTPSDDKARQKVQAWEAILYGLNKGIANFRLTGWEKLEASDKETFFHTILNLYAEKEDLDRAKIVEFCHQLFVELDPEWQYKFLLVMYAIWRAGQFQAANCALQVLKKVWNIISEKNREEALHLLALSVENQKDAFINREIVGTLQILHNKLVPEQKQWLLQRYFEWLPGKTPEFLAGTLDAIRDLLEDLTIEERVTISKGKYAEIASFLGNKNIPVTLSAMQIIELLGPFVEENAQMRFLDGATMVLKKKDTSYYRDVFTSLKNVWARFSPDVITQSVIKLHPLLLKIYQKKDNLEENVAETFEDFFEVYWESLPDTLKSQYY